MRPASADLNATFGMALVAMIAWLFISLKVAGPKFFIIIIILVMILRLRAYLRNFAQRS